MVVNHLGIRHNNIMKTCNKCGKKDLTWNTKWHDYSGKWQLTNHKNKDGDWCVNNIIKPKETKLTKKDFTMCPLCTDSNFGKCLTKDYDEHKRKFHPNNEVLTELDYIHEHMSAYAIKRYWKHDPHYSKFA